MEVDQLKKISQEMGLPKELTKLSVLYGYKASFLTDIKSKGKKIPQPLLNQVELRLQIKDKKND